MNTRQPAKNSDPMTVLIVEDEADMARILEYNVQRAGHRPVVVGNGRTALTRIRSRPPDLVLLDLRLPDTSGIEVLRKLKEDEALARIPVIVVSALGDEDTVVEALNLGADDYVVKPFRTRELLARVSAVLRRGGSGESGREDEPRKERIAAGPLVLDSARFEVRVHDRPVSLTRTEFVLLAFLAAQPGRVFTRRQLCDKALGAGGFIRERTIDAHIRTIRRKLGEAGACIVTVWGVGYRFDPEGGDGGGDPTSPADAGRQEHS